MITATKSKPSWWKLAYISLDTKEELGYWKFQSQAEALKFLLDNMGGSKEYADGYFTCLPMYKE
jgi:hypothetical protein